MYLEKAEKFKEVIEDYIWKSDLPPGEKRKRFEIACMTARFLDEIKREIFWDFLNNIKKNIEDLSSDLKIDSDIEGENIDIYKPKWERIGISYWIDNKCKGSSAGSAIGIYIANDTEELKNIWKYFKNNLVDIQNLVKEKVDRLAFLPFNEEDFIDWGGIVGKKLIIPNLPYPSGWFKGKNAEYFLAEYLENSNEIVRFYTQEFKNFYELTVNKIDEFVEKCLRSS